MFQNRSPIEEGDGKAHATTVAYNCNCPLSRNKDWFKGIQQVFKMIQI